MPRRAALPFCIFARELAWGYFDDDDDANPLCVCAFRRLRRLLFELTSLPVGRSVGGSVSHFSLTAFLLAEGFPFSSSNQF